MIEKKEKKKRTTALIPFVQSTPEKTPPDKAHKIKQKKAKKPPDWAWTKQKRAAVKLVVKGATDVAIANEVGVHRNTVRNWKEQSEFRTAVMHEARSYVQRMRFKRVYETGIITDQLMAQIARRLTAMTKKGTKYADKKDKKGAEDADAINQVEINAMQMFLREYREFREQERMDFGDNVRRVEGTFHFGMGFGTNAAEQQKKSLGAQSFQKFLESHTDKIPQRVIENAATPQDALINSMAELLRKTDILDAMHAEDEEMQGEQ